MKSAELHLPYFKQGDDLAGCLEQSKDNVVEALKMHAGMLEFTAKMLSDLATKIVDSGKADEFEIEAGTHFIGISGPDDIITDLIEKEVLDKGFECEDEDCDCDCNCEEE